MSIKIGPCSCCTGSLINWIYTDEGFVLGGQNGAPRSYALPGSVAASPWLIAAAGLSLRCTFENDANCTAQHGPPNNPFTQRATATATLTLPVATVMTVAWSGLGERQSPGFDVMNLLVNNVQQASAHAPGGGQGCAPMGPVVSNPASPVVVMLGVGTNTFLVQTSTQDRLFHYGSYYQFDLTFNPPIP